MFESRGNLNSGSGHITMLLTEKISIYTKLAAVIFIVILFLVVTSVLRLIIREGRKKTAACIVITSAFTRVLLSVLGVKLKADTKSLKSGENFLVVSNHLSYLDTLIISSRVGTVFIASVDGHQQEFPLGLITKNSGGIFVERNSRKALREDMGKITAALSDGFNVVLFPEGTTSNGEGLLPFKSSFLNPAGRAGVKIIPVCINYRRLDGHTVGQNNKNKIFFYEDISFIDHFMRLLSVSEIEVTLDSAPEADFRDFSARKELSDHLFKEITGIFEPK